MPGLAICVARSGESHALHRVHPEWRRPETQVWFITVHHRGLGPNSLKDRYHELCFHKLSSGYISARLGAMV